MMEKFKKDLDAASASALAEKGRRGHLGASGAGSRCARQVWYGFHWYHQEKFDGRMLRLFNRGHDEEFRVVRWLRAAGIEVQDYQQRLIWNEDNNEYLCEEWDTSQWVDYGYIDVSESAEHIKLASDAGNAPRQWAFSVDIGGSIEPSDGYEQGHYAGSSDGRLRGLERWFPELDGLGWGLFENKTASEKSFVDTQRNGVRKSKPEHYAQMQQYMHFLHLKWALYVVVNKNNDDLYLEIVHYQPEVAYQLADKALKIVAAHEPPPKAMQDPSNFICRFCSYKEHCHYGKMPDRNCRTCVFSEPSSGGQWTCNLHKQEIPYDFTLVGCTSWEPNG